MSSQQQLKVNLDSQTISSSQSKVSNTNDPTWGSIVWEVVKFGVTIGVTLYVTRQLVTLLADVTKQIENTATASQASKAALAKRLKRPEIETMDFDKYEERLMVDVISPDEIHAGFADVGGLQDVVDEVKDHVVLPMQIWNYNRKSYNTGAISPCPTGVLLYGCPGTGKSLIAKAIAKEAGATFISITASSILDKFMGESDRLASALFKLGRKLGPSIIFIDEIETLLRKRGNSSNDIAVATMQGVFLSEWDGLTASRKDKDTVATPPVVILGATNRPGDLDAAFLRRMPVQIQTQVPDETARLQILRAQLRHEKLAEDVDLSLIAKFSVDFTGSDLKEVIRIAELTRTKEITQQMKTFLEEEALKSKESNNSSSGTAVGDTKIRSNSSPFQLTQRHLKQSDFVQALRKKIASAKIAGKFISETNSQSTVSELEKYLEMILTNSKPNTDSQSV